MTHRDDECQGGGLMGNGDHCDPIVLAHAVPFRVGTVHAEPSACLLRHDDGEEKSVEPRIMQVLVALARVHGAPVTRDELIASCWSGRSVSNDAVSRVISLLRGIAQGFAGGSFQVETLNKVGYRLVEPVRATPIAPMEPSTPTPAPPTRRTALAIAGTAGALVAGGWWFSTRRNHEEFSPHPVGDTSLVVMPFTAGDATLVASARIATAAMRDDLNHVPGVRILAAPGDTVAAAAATGPATLSLTASLSHDGDALAAVLIMTEVASGRQLWSGRVAVPAAQVGDLSRDAAGAVIEALLLRLPVTQIRPVDASLRGDPEAYRLCKEARALRDEVRERFVQGDPEQAQQLADEVAALTTRALALQPEYAPALVLQAELARSGWSQTFAALKLTSQQRVDAALMLLRRAIRSDPTNSAAMSSLADIYRRFGWRWDDAETLFLHALANDPGNADAHWAYSHQLATLGRARDALGQTDALRALDWTHLWRRITLPRMLYLLGRRGAALAAYYAELDTRPESPFLLWEIYYLHAAERSGEGLQRLIGTLAARWRGRAMPPAVAATMARARAAIAALSGSPAALLAILDEERIGLDAGALSRATLGGRARDDLGFILAIEYACAGSYDRAIAMLDQALAAKSLYWPAALPYGNAPFPAAMRDDPRYAALWRRDPRLADAVERRRRAALSGQMATVGPDGHVTLAKPSRN